MTMDTYQASLRAATAPKKILVDRDGTLRVALSADNVNPSFEVEVNRSYLDSQPALCQPFEATSPRIPIPLPVSVVAPLIDPVRWGDFSDLKTSNPSRDPDAWVDGWKGTIDEKFDWRFLGMVVKYRNRLTIDYAVSADQGRIDFSLHTCFEGDLAAEKGYLMVTDGLIPGTSYLVCAKRLQYKLPSPWCSLPKSVLQKILEVWLTMVTAEYALRMVESSIYTAGVDLNLNLSRLLELDGSLEF